MATTVTSRVFKGSGYIYVREHSDANAFPGISDLSALYTWLAELGNSDNELGYIKNGYKFTESLTTLEDQSDMGQLKVLDISEETAESAFNLFNVNTATLEKMHPLTTTAESGDVKIATIGGLTNMKDTTYDVLFVHKDTVEGDICVYTVGRNMSGLELSFQPNAVTPIACTYKSLTLDDTGVLAKVIELPTNFDWSTGTVTE